MNLIASLQTILTRPHLRVTSISGNVVLLAAMGAGPVLAPHVGRHVSPPAPTSVSTTSGPSDSSEVVDALARFHAALAAGDSAAAIRLLASDALIIEGGDVQTRADYQAHHLPADIAYARAVPSTRTVTKVVMRGEMASVTTTSATQGTYRERPVNSVGAELAVLVRAPTVGWQIQSIHWSSHAKRP